MLAGDEPPIDRLSERVRSLVLMVMMEEGGVVIEA